LALEDVIITRLEIGAISLQQRVNVERPALAPRQDVGGERSRLRQPQMELFRQ
jgi:hypothetical protein